MHSASIPSPGDSIRYQLLHRAASAMVEARRFNAAHAMMLVHSFSPSDEWFDDYTGKPSFSGLRKLPTKIERPTTKPWVSLPPPETSTFPTLLQYPLLAGPIEGVIHFKGCARSIPVVCRGRWRWVAQVPPVQKLSPSSLPTPEPRPGRLPAP